MLEELKFIAKLLEREGLRYMIGGGIATSYWGHPRSTTDIDMVVADFYASEREALQRVEKELKKEGWKIRADVGRSLIAEKGALRLDFWNVKSLYDRERFERRIRVKIEDFQIWITSPEDLVLQKLLWFRGKDIEDIRGIITRQKNLDWDYIKKWAEKLEVEDRLESVLRR